MKPELSVVIPVYNEQKTILQVIKNVLLVELVTEIIVVDDGSNDKTGEFLKNFSHPRVKVAHHERNKGKTAAIKTAMQLALCDICLIQDADLEYNPEEIPVVLAPIFSLDTKNLPSTAKIGFAKICYVFVIRDWGFHILPLLYNYYKNKSNTFSLK